MTAVTWDDLLVEADGNAATPSLNDRFVVPPFSVLDTRQGYWRERRNAWLSIGIQSELGRGDNEDRKSNGRGEAMPLNIAMGHRDTGQFNIARAQIRDVDQYRHRAAADARSNLTGAPEQPDWADNGMTNMAPGTSIFDPVLCELAYRWFTPAGGTVLDPFAGGSVRGIVAAMLGHAYTGIDLSVRQLEANREQADRILPAGHPIPHWIAGDSRDVLPTIADGETDLIFSCPPYFDLEIYSDDPSDLSAMSWVDFLTAYEAIIEAAAAKLRRDRYAVWVISEVRDKAGMCRGLVPRTIHAFERVGLHLYNEAVLVNPAGTLPIRITRQFEASRKLGRTHQNILVFVKGEPPRGWSYDRDAPPEPQLSMFPATGGPVGPTPPPINEDGCALVVPDVPAEEWL